METKVDIEQLKELLEFVGYVAEKSISALKDGAQITDLAILADLELFSKAKLAIDGINQIGTEVAHLDLNAAKDVIVLAVDIVSKCVAAAKKV